MKAVILVGGQGTRMRPLTYTIPKTLLPFCNTPVIEYQLDALKKVSVSKTILAVGECTERFKNLIPYFSQKYSMDLVLSIEDKPLGTAGCLKLAESKLDLQESNSFIVLNSDIICDFPLKKMIEYHESNKREATILVNKMQDTSKYGTVMFDADLRVTDFLEKQSGVCNQYINSGVYILRKSVLNLIPFHKLRNVSLEREVFPRLVDRKDLYVYDKTFFWLDLGESKEFLHSLHKFLLHKSLPSKPLKSCIIKNPILVHNKGTIIGENCVIGPTVCIEKNTEIGDNVQIQNSIIMEGVKIANHCVISNSIIGPFVKIETQYCLIEESIIGEKSIIKVLNLTRACIFPNKQLNV